MKNAIKRNRCIDILKAFSCIMIVYIHSLNLYSYAGKELPYVLFYLNNIVKCGVPIFFMISGYLSIHGGGYKYTQLLFKKIKSLLIPFIIWNFIYLIFEIVGHWLIPSVFDDVTKWNFVDLVTNLFGIPFVKPPIYEPLWFVRELFILFLLYPIIVFCVSYISDIILLALLAVIAIINIPMLYNGGYMLNTSFPFFCLGIWLGKGGEKQRNIIEFIRKREFIIVSTCIAVGLSFVYNTFDINSIIKSAIRTFIMLLYLPIIYYAAKSIEKNNSSLNKIFIDIAKYSFMIYVLHGKLLTIIQNICIKLFPQNAVILVAEFMIFPILVIIIVIGIAAALNKILPSLYRFLIGGR